MVSTAAGTDLCTGGTAVASTEYAGGGYEASKAFDNNTTTRWNNNGSTLPSWIEYQFASAVDIVEYRVTASNASPAVISPKNWTFEYWDGSAWQVFETVTNQTGWTAGQVRTFTPGIPTAYIRASHVPIETVQEFPAPTQRVTQLAVEVVQQVPGPPARVTQFGLEVIELVTAPARVTQFGVEVLGTNDVVIPPFQPRVWMGDGGGKVWVE